MINKKDELILKELKKNSRETATNISKKLNIPRVTIHDRIQKMIQNKIIKNFTVIPDYKKINLGCKVFIFASFKPDSDVSQKELAKKISKINGIYEVDIISGEYDLLLKARGSSLDDIGKLVVEKLRQIKGVERTLTFACFDTIKEET
jgi:DNA-binding Lrp family transcriptional regulator